MKFLANKINQPIVVIGAGGHAKVVISTLQACGSAILGFTNTSSEISSILGVPFIGSDQKIEEYNPKEILLAIGIGSIKSNNNRKRIFELWKNKNYSFAIIIHPSAIIDNNSEISEGAQILMGTTIQTGVKIKENCIINTKSSIDHDSIIHSHSHISPGATICGNVIIGTSCHIGASATIIQNIQIGEQSTIGAGAVVIKHAEKNGILAGVPAKYISNIFRE